MKILFICKYNAFRSRVAEEYFKRINKNKKIQVISRGIIMGGNSDREQKKLSREILGIDIAKRNPLPLKINEMKEADLIVVVANDVPKVIFNYWNAPILDKVVIWKIKDEQKMNRKNIRRIVLKIRKKVERLAKQMEKKR